MWLAYVGDPRMRFMLMLAMCNTFYAFRDSRENATKNTSLKDRQINQMGREAVRPCHQLTVRAASFLYVKFASIKGQISTSMEGRRFEIVKQCAIIV